MLGSTLSEHMGTIISSALVVLFWTDNANSSKQNVKPPRTRFAQSLVQHPMQVTQPCLQLQTPHYNLIMPSMNYILPVQRPSVKRVATDSAFSDRLQERASGEAESLQLLESPGGDRYLLSGRSRVTKLGVWEFSVLGLFL